MENTLPHDINAEAALLGSIMIDPEALTRADFLEPEDFYRESHRLIFTAIRDLAHEGTPPDYITICEQLERNQRIEVIGAGYVASLVNQTPTSARAEHYARIVQRKSGLRKVIETAGKLAARAYEEMDLQELLSSAGEMIYTIGLNDRAANPLIYLQDSVTRYMKKLEEDIANQFGQPRYTGVETGIPALDIVTNGFQKTDLITIAARPGKGKTALAATLARNSKKAGFNGIFFSVEMGEMQITQRLLSREAGINQSRLQNRNISEDEWPRLVDAMHTLTREIDEETGAPQGIWVTDPSSTITPAQIKSRCMYFLSKHQLDYVYVDYIQRVRPNEKCETRALAVGSIARDLKSVARDLHIPVIVLAQLSREGAYGIPRMEQLKESGDIEQESDLIGLLYEEGDEEVRVSPYPVLLDIVKHRNGPLTEIPLKFTPHLTLFEGFLPPEPEEPEVYRRPYAE